MIYTSIKYLRIGLIVVGFLLLISSIFIPYYSGCRWNEDESGTVPFLVFGYEAKVYWIQLSLTIALFISGYFYHTIFNKVLLYMFSLMLLLFLFILWNAPTFGGAPCIRGAEIGKNLCLFGSLFILLGTFISIYRETE